MKYASIFVCTVEVMCPYCRDMQPNPDNGGHPWTPSEIELASTDRVAGLACAQCGETFMVRMPSWLRKAS